MKAHGYFLRSSVRTGSIYKKYNGFLYFVLFCAAFGPAAFAGGDPLTPDSILFQTFYWDVPAGGTWYNTIAAAAPGLKEAGFTHFWFPPPTKGASGANSMGYDLYDNYDLGQYNQKGTVETRFGSLTELQAAAAACENVLLDLVANHMSGGQPQKDPVDGKTYYQKFQYVHGNFWKSPEDFHPGSPDDCDLCDGNDYLMMEDVCHQSSYMFNGQLEWARWMKETVGNVSGFRLDAVKHFSWDMSRAFGTVGDCIGEYWDGRDKIVNWMNYTGDYAFDFPLYYALQGNAADLDAAGLLHSKSISFVRNHDVDEVTHKYRAYGYILFIEPIPCVFWSDWFNPNLQIEINRALQARRHYDFTGTRTLLKRDDLIIFTNNTPVYGCFSHNPEVTGGWIQTEPNAVYSAIAWGPGSEPADCTADESGNVYLTAPPYGYCYWYSGSDPGQPEDGYATNYTRIYVPGDNEQVFGCWWSFTPANQMTLVDDYTWRWIGDCPAATHAEYKFAMNGTWDINRGLGSSSGASIPQLTSNLQPFGANISVDLPEGICVWEYHEQTDTGRDYTIDFNGDHRIGLADFAWMTSYWLNDLCGEPDWCGASDTDRSGLIDFRDLRPLFEYWMRNL